MSDITESYTTNGIDDDDEFFDFEDSDESTLDDGELEKGYLRQQDYTRKTQELAELRREAETGLAILQALASDPNTTISMLAEQYGMVGGGDEDDDLLPVERETRELQNRVAQIEQQTRAAQLENDVVKAMSDHSLEGEPDELIKYMIAENIGNPRTAARLLALELQAEEADVRTERVMEAKRGIPASNGNRRAGARAEAKPTNIREAFKMAARQHGLHVDDD